MIFLWCYFELTSTPGKLKKQACMTTARIEPATFGILSYAARSVRVCDTSELTLCINLD